MFAMAAGFALPALQPYAPTIAVVGTLAYIAAFATGAGPVPGLIVPELNPLSTRGAWDQGLLQWACAKRLRLAAGGRPIRRFLTRPYRMSPCY